MYTNKRSTTGLLAAAALFGVTALTGAQAANVTFSDINDAVNAPPAPNELFDASATAPDGGDANKLVIALDNFKADGANANTISALDTISFMITAPLNYVITKVTYEESGSRTMTGTGGVTVASGNWVVGGDASDLGLHVFTSGSGNWALDSFFEFSVGDNVTELPVSITNSLLAFGGTSSIIEKTAASVAVELAFVPIPPAVFLLGSALLGLVVVGRREAA